MRPCSSGSEGNRSGRPARTTDGGPPTSTSFRIARVLAPGRFAVPLPPKHARRRRAPRWAVAAILFVLRRARRARLRRLRARACPARRRRAPRDGQQFVHAWEKGDYDAMYALLDARSQQANPKISFLADYRRANRAATVEKVTIGRVGPLLQRRDGARAGDGHDQGLRHAQGDAHLQGERDRGRRHARRVGARAAASPACARARRSAAAAARRPRAGTSTPPAAGC